MALVTLRASSTHTSGDSVRTGGTTKNGVVSDDSDATYLQVPSNKLFDGANAGEFTTWDEFYLVDLPAQPTGAKVTSTEIRVRSGPIVDRAYAGSREYAYIQFEYVDADAGGTTYLTDAELVSAGHPSTAIITEEVWRSFRTTRPDGRFWTWESIRLLRMRARIKDGRYHEFYVDVIYNERPVTVVDRPSGTISDTTRPTPRYSYSDPEGDQQSARRLKVFSAAQFQAADFDPEASTAVYDTGKEFVISTTFDLTEDLPNNTLYRAYVKTWQSYQEEHASAWAYSEFTIAVLPPNNPTISATTELVNSRVKVDTFGHDNLTSANQASVETDTAGFVAQTNVTLARSTAQARYGGASLSMTAVAAGLMEARTTGVPVVVGIEYTALASFRSAATARNVKTMINWYLAADGTGYISTSSPGWTADTTTGWTQSAVTATAPANALSCRIIMQVDGAAAGEVHYADGVGIFPGTVTVWAPGGMAAQTEFIVEYSDDDGVTWWEHPRMGGAHDGVATQRRADYDYELASGVGRRYRAKTFNPSPALASGLSGETAEQSLTFDSWWVKVPTNSVLNFVPKRGFSWLEREYDLRTSVLNRFRKINKAVSQGVPSGAGFDMRLVTLTEDEYQAVFKALTANVVLLVQSPQGRQWYVAPAGEMTVSELVTEADSPDVVGVYHRFELPVVEVGPT